MGGAGGDDPPLPLSHSPPFHTSAYTSVVNPTGLRQDNHFSAPTRRGIGGYRSLGFLASSLIAPSFNLALMLVNCQLSMTYYRSTIVHVLGQQRASDMFVL